MSSQTDSESDTGQRYERLAALTNKHCRFVLHYFRNASEDNSFASLEDLSTAFARENDEDEDRAAVHLHHIALPKLSDVGVVDYDAQSKTVRYHGHSELEDLLDVMDSASESPSTEW